MTTAAVCFTGAAHSHELLSGDLAREHVRLLGERGLSLQEIARQGGVADKTLERLMSGSRVEVSTQRSVMSVTGWEILTETTVGRRHVDGTGTRRRLQALAARGWTSRQLAGHHSSTRQKIRQALVSAADDPVTADFARSVTVLYEQLWDQDPPCLDGAAMARQEAHANAWAPPMAWDDEDLDEPTAEPAPTQERATGRRKIYLEDLEDLASWGLGPGDAAERLHVSIDAVEACTRRAKRPDIMTRLRTNHRARVAA